MNRKVEKGLTLSLSGVDTERNVNSKIDFMIWKKCYLSNTILLFIFMNRQQIVDTINNRTVGYNRDSIYPDIFTRTMVEFSH